MYIVTQATHFLYFHNSWMALTFTGSKCSNCCLQCTIYIHIPVTSTMHMALYQCTNNVWSLDNFRSIFMFGCSPARGPTHMYNDMTDQYIYIPGLRSLTTTGLVAYWHTKHVHVYIPCAKWRKQLRFTQSHKPDSLGESQACDTNPH